MFSGSSSIGCYLTKGGVRFGVVAARVYDRGTTADLRRLFPAVGAQTQIMFRLIGAR